jgi:sarcosine oxidase subunit gamma
MDEMTPRARSPLAELVLATQTTAPDDMALVSVRSLPYAGYVSVRGKPDDAAFLSTVRAMLELDLPLSVSETVETELYRVFWLGPDHWLVVCNDGEAPVLTDRLQAAFAGVFGAAINVSGARSRLRLTGEAAADLLATGCKLDVSPSALSVGGCVQAPLGNATAIMHCVSQEPLTYDVYVARSQALSFWKWLEHAGAEFGMKSVTS